MDSIKWAPRGTGAWLFNRDKSSGMTRLRENRTYVREVAEKLIGEKRQELEDGTSGKDLLSLLGPSPTSFVRQDRWYDFQFFSQGKFCTSTGLAAER
jgi:hypothetical protein